MILTILRYKVMKLGLKRKIVLVFVGVLAAVTVLDALLASYFTNRQNQDAAFARLKRDILTWQDELQELTLHMRTVALSAVGETVALNQLSDLKALEYKLTDALDKNKEVKEAARTLAFSKSVSLNRLHLVLRSVGFSAIAVYIDGKLSHQVSESEVGMFVQRGNGRQVWLKAAADSHGNLPIRSWPAWEEGRPPAADTSLSSLDKAQIAFTYPSADSMMIEVAVPVEGVIDHSLQQGDLNPSELSVIDPHVAGSVSDPSIFSVNRPLSSFAVVIFQKRIDRAFLETVERKTGMWPILFSPDGHFSQQLGALKLSLQLLQPEFAKADSEVTLQTISTSQGSFYTATLPWRFEQQSAFVLALVASEDSTLQNIRQTVAAILTVTSLILAFSIGVSIFWVGRFIDPIIVLTNAVKAVGLVSRLERDRQSDCRLTLENLRPLAIHAPGEIGDLAWAFDVMIGELHYSFDRLEQRVQERTVELLALQQVLEKQNRKLEKQSYDLSIANRLLQEEINERKQAEDKIRVLNANLEQRVLERTEELRQQTRYLRTMIDTLPMMVWFKDTDSRFLVVNQAFAIAAARSQNIDDLIGKCDFDFWPRAHAEVYRADDAEVMATRQRKTVEDPFVDVYKGAIWIETFKAAVLDEDGRVLGTIGVARDISKRKAVEAAQDAALAEAERLARLRSEFMARMSHELRTPLNGILGYAQILLGENRLDERHSVMVSVIQQSGEHLLGLINDILDFAKIEAGKQELNLSDISLRSFLGKLNNIIKVKAEEKQLAFVCGIAADVPEGIRADETRLRQVLLNLLSNAVKYTEQGQVSLRVMVMKKPFPEGRLAGMQDDCMNAGGRATQGAVAEKEQRRSSCRERAYIEPSRSLSGVEADCRLRFEIQDTGIGINAGQLETIFQPFEQAADSQYSGGGTGLGLVISRELVRLMGGEIYVISRVGEGSTFWFELDAQVVEAYRDFMTVEHSVVGYQGERRRVLVVDDVEANRSLLIEIMNSLGFESVEAINGRACLGSVEIWQPDLILLDMVMPEMDGLETARRLRCVPGFEQTPIIAVSAGASGVDVAEAMKAGVNVFLSKPIEIKKLMAQIGGLLNLNWIYTSPKTEPPSQHKSCGWLDAPPLEEMKVLHHLAQQGNMRDIIQQAKYLCKLDMRYIPFAEQLSRLAKGYQSKTILNFVERYINRQHTT